MIKPEFCLRGHSQIINNVYKNGNCKVCATDRCKSLYKNDPVYRSRKLEYAKQYQKTDKWRSASLRKEYGITLKERNKMAEKQDNCCLVCKVPESTLTRPLNIDHNHTTRKIRGLLCGNCNTAISLVKEDVNILRSLIIYLGETNV